MSPKRHHRHASPPVMDYLAAAIGWVIITAAFVAAHVGFAS